MQRTNLMKVLNLKWFGLFLLLISVIIFQSGCSISGGNSSNSTSCTSNAQCSTGQVCQNGSCVTQNTSCTSNAQCLSGQVCQNGSCVTQSTFSIPDPPTNVSAIAGYQKVALQWVGTVDAISYNIYDATSFGGPYTKIGFTSTTGYTVTGLTNGTTYDFIVTSVNSAGESSQNGVSNWAVAIPFTPSVVIYPQSSTIWMGQTQTFTATAYDASGNPLSNTQFTWSSVNSPTATVITSTSETLVVGTSEAGTQEINITGTSLGTTFTSTPAVLTVNGNIGGGYALKAAVGTVSTIEDSSGSCSGGTWLNELAWIVTIRASDGSNSNSNWNITYADPYGQTDVSSMYFGSFNPNWEVVSIDNLANWWYNGETYNVTASNGSITLMTTTTILGTYEPFVTGASASSNGSGSATISWTAIGGAQSYKVVLYDTDVATIYFLKESSYIDSTSYTFTGLIPGNLYFYSVYAFSMDLSQLMTDTSQFPSELDSNFNVSYIEYPSYGNLVASCLYYFVE